jgi:signal transduction histidine kinase
MVQGSARHLLSVINDVLDISKIEAGQLEVYSEAFDFLAAAEKVVGSMQPMSRVKGLELTLTAPAGLPPLISDRRRVEQILLNLLNNAIKFTERGTVSLKVELLESYTMRTAAKAQRCIQFQVADTGIGIRPEHLPNLFKPFQQIDSGLTRMHEGTGLGLSICRRLVELLHGDIYLNSEFRVGTAVTVTLPLASSGS